MSKLLKGSIDLNKINESVVFKGAKGAKYINVDIWINEDADNYGNHAGIKQSTNDGESFKSHYIGNAKKSFGWADVVENEKTSESKPLPF